MKILIFNYPYLMMTVFFVLGGFFGMLLAGLMRIASNHDTHLEVRTRDDELEAMSWRSERD